MDLNEKRVHHIIKVAGQLLAKKDAVIHVITIAKTEYQDKRNNDY